MPRKRAARKTLDSSLPIFQLKITLEDIEPAIWRRIETHDCTLADLHEVIQSCMGWDDEHMYAFEIGDDQYTDLSRGADPHEFCDSRPLRLSNLVERGEYCFVYEYDFGDSWRHTIEIENTLPAEQRVRYPRCVDGQRACPPEDCGGSCGYCELLEALANPDEEKYDERLEWLGDEFDPEKFSVEKANAELLRLRRWIGQHPRLQGKETRFAVGDRVRAKRGAVHSEYPDIPLGGWVGTVTKIARLVPIGYEVRWTDETLAAAHPVYAKRCRRDDAKPQSYWLDEDEVELDAAESPTEMEQPANLIVKPLSADDQDDRIRMAFGLTSDDPLPTISDEAERQYFDYMQAHLTFPFNASYWSELTPYSSADKHGSVVGLVSPSPADVARGVLCEVHRQDQVEQVPLVNLELDEDDQNCQYVDDYRYWLQEVQEFAAFDVEDDGQYWDDNGPEDEEEGEDEDDEDDEDDESDIGLCTTDDLGSGAQDPQPIRRERPPVGRNDPCPCGSGKKFKKCCLRRHEEGIL